FPAGKPDENYPEIRQRQIENLDHGQNVFFFVFASNQALGGPAATGLIRRLPLASATILVYSTIYDKNADRQISDRADRSPPDFFIPGRDLRYRSGIQQYRGMVAFDP